MQKLRGSQKTYNNIIICAETTNSYLADYFVENAQVAQLLNRKEEGK